LSVTDWLRKLFDNNEREIARYRTVVAKINALEPEFEKLSNTQLRDKTEEFRAYVQSEWQRKLDEIERNGVLESERRDKVRKALDEVLDSILPEAFALVREAAKRTLGQRHYDVQLIGGMVAHDGRIAELKTGEGKTLMATLPLYLNALAGRGAHLVTANDYLSKVGAVWMGPIYHLLGMSVGIIQGQSPETGEEGGSYIYDPDYEDPDPRFTYCRPITRREAYECDITYGTNNEFGFDYLRDNMQFSADALVMRDLHYAIVDEVDSILIDEARTPLIISGFVEQDTSKYYQVDRVVRQLRAGKEAKTQQEREDPNSDRNNPNIDYLVDEKQKTVALTDAGIAKVERLLGVRNLAEDPELMHYVTASMKAHALFKKDIDYVVRDGEIIIVDEFTGRLMFGRRYSDGLHQAIEAKENVEIKHESQTLATITFQNLFRLYLKLAGMTGTAKTEEDEFRKIYGLDVVVVPTNKPMIRIDHPDVIYKVAEHKFRGIAAEILRLYGKQQPVLVGTRSIEMSEKVSSRISAHHLQLLVMVTLIRAALETSKAIDKAKKAQWVAILNSNLEELTPSRLTAMARELGVHPDPLTEENLRRVAEWLSLPADSETLGHLDEALRHGIPHNILNAKYHEKEAIIIAEAGRKGAVTIATNMAGRGVDIILGGKPQEQELPPGQDPELVPVGVGGASEQEDAQDKKPEEPGFRRGGKPSVLDTVTTLTPEEHQKAADEVRALGGLFILGTERHESRRIDNQLRGRAGRQGDPGESRFFVSLEDELWRLFGDRSQHPLLRTWPEDQPMETKILSKMIERAQKKVEEHHFEMRKHVLQYDDVMNKQREVIYGERRRILEGADLRETIIGFLHQTIRDAVDMFCPETQTPQEWDLDELYDGLAQYFPLANYAQPSDLQGKSREELRDYLTELIERAYCDKEKEIAEVAGYPDAMRDIERQVALSAINRKWMEHLANMDYLREGIGLRGYAQQDPLVIYQKEAFEMFENMQHSIQNEIAQYMFHVQLVKEQPRPRRQYPTWTNLDNGAEAASADGRGPAQRPRSEGRKKLGRNDPCWCGSGKKYKHCHYPN
jgi:preprotein translocase subunit SecA